MTSSRRPPSVAATRAGRRDSGWRVLALVLGIVALVAVRSAVRGWPWWAAGLACILAFALVTRSINLLRPAIRRRRQPRR